MRGLEILLQKRLKSAELNRALGEDETFVLAALQDLILITLKESRSSQERFEEILTGLDFIVKSLQQHKQTIQHVQVVNMEKPVRDMRITNFDEFPRSVKIENFNELRTIKVSNIVAIVNSIVNAVKFPKEIGIKKPSWWDGFNFSKLVNELSLFSSTLLKGIKKIAQNTVIKNKEPKDAIAVRLVTPDGRNFYKAEGETSYAVVGGGTNYGGSPVNITPVDVDDSGNSSHTISGGRTTLSIQNAGSKTVAFGGPGLSYNAACKIVPRQWYSFLGCPKGFKVYFICDSTQSSKIVGFER